jgi:hypothetical protein
MDWNSRRTVVQVGLASYVRYRVIAPDGKVREVWEPVTSCPVHRPQLRGMSECDCLPAK